jgi:hypothetical protein
MLLRTYMITYPHVGILEDSDLNIMETKWFQCQYVHTEFYENL